MLRTSAQSLCRNAAKLSTSSPAVTPQRITRKAMNQSYDSIRPQNSVRRIWHRSNPRVRIPSQPHTEQFCHKTEFSDRTILLSTNTNWSVNLSSATHGQSEHDLILQLFIRMLSRSPSLVSDVPPAHQLAMHKGTLSATLPKEDFDFSAAQLFEEQGRSNLTLRLESYEGNDWKIAFTADSKSVATNFQEALASFRVDTTSELLEAGLVEPTKPSLVIRIPSAHLKGSSLKKTADKLADTLEHPLILPYVTEAPSSLNLAAHSAPKVETVTL